MAADDTETLRVVTEQLLRLQGHQHPGRPTFYALSRAVRAVEDAALEVRRAREAMYGPEPRAAE